MYRVRPDNFTPPDRTPWGGRAIVGRFKAGLDLGVDPSVPVGESWEISTEPSFPTVLESGDRLADVIAQDPRAWLGERVAAEHAGCPLLVKLIDAADNLSVQVHPAEDSTLLAEGETGKTEAWMILAVAPAARIYLGFRDDVDAARVEACLAAGGVLSDLMNAVPVHEGQVFMIRPGLAHAIGAGVTLLEPQRVRPHRRSITYRFWDWNRRYDRSGTVSADGEPRPLHVREALLATEWRGPRGAALVERCRREPAPLHVDDVLGRWQVLDEPELSVERWVGTGSAQLPHIDTLRGLVCLEGELDLTADGRSLRLRSGQSAVVPAAVTDVGVELRAARLEVCCVPPTAGA